MKQISDLAVQAQEAADAVGSVILDVRRRPVFKAATDQIAGSTWRDPAEVSQWLRELDPTIPTIVYCVHGHEVSQGVAMALNAGGIPVRYIQGGIEAWREAELPLQNKIEGAVE
ncbi:MULTISPECIES: rhodanese-like domain-containing protein [Achromobacter]|uniref:Rhodanese-like domain-containing protein n=1 Tax=Achromobacter spanius TaxID=217203 RepID=A0ABY8GWI5_9BURK|nr:MULTISPECIES: rhodanese-like domain-containing protein [Achromobacter]WAI81526.1 rhodanese-like domain-containing protein [Achromobacter spanius]WEX97043.1 rhodanese-like domain-containing protein [Achromobacter sp. SS2-2022]WFP09240.1 rhodanese-like domain-containing protein [Achromobacter spanius]